MMPLSDALSSSDYEERLVNDVKQRNFSLSFREDGNYNNCYYSSHPSSDMPIKTRLSNEDTPFVLTPKIAESPKIHKFDRELEYDGFVISINLEERSFTARIVNVKSNSEEEGEFSLDELDGDENLVMPGAVFTWVIGLQFRGTRKQRVSDIRFRRHAALPREVILEAESKASELSRFINDHTSHEPITLTID